MGILKKIRIWWKSTPMTAKVGYILGGVGVVAGAAAAVASVRQAKTPPVVVENPEERQNDILEEANESEKETPMFTVDASRSDWEVWNPDWNLKYESKSGYESDRLADTLELFVYTGENDECMTQEDLNEAAARVQDLARQFAYLEGAEDEFRTRFWYLKDRAADIYTNVTVEKKGE